MAALDFPASPVLNQTYIVNGKTWTWNGTSWVSTLSFSNITGTQITNALGYTPGTVSSIGISVPIGLSISNTPITSSGTISIGLTAGYSIPTTASQTNWDTAFTDRNKWDGGATGLTAATGRTSLGGTTLGQSMFTLTNPSAVTFPRFNADNTVAALDAATFRTAIAAGTVTSVTGGGSVSGLTLSGTVSTTGSLTLGGTLSVLPSNFAAQAANTVLVAPNGSSGTPTFRTLAAADIPALDASKITTGVFSSAQLPSYVDDVLEYNNLAAFPTTGEAGKIYVALDTNKTYRWSGTVYVFITSGAVDSVGGYTGVISASNLLTALTTVDGNGSGLDADLLDGQHASAFYLATNPNGYTTNTGTVTGVTATAPVVSSGGNAPVISMAAANSTTNGYMTSTYAAKLDGIAAGATTNTGTVTSVGGSGTVAGISLSGTITTAGTLQLSGTLSTPANTINDSTLTGQNFIKLTNPNAITFVRINADNSISTLDAATFRTAIGAGSGTGNVTGVTATAPVISSGGTAPVISMVAANTTTNGYLTSTDWNTFNNKANVSHTQDASSITTGVFGNNGLIGLANHPEGGGLLTPAFDNDLAFITQKGGSVAFYYTDSIDYTAQALNNLGTVGFSTTIPFNGTPTYATATITSISSVVICDITMPFSLSYGNTWYIDFGNASWMAKNVSFYAYQTSGNTETVYKLVGSAITNNTQHLKFTSGTYSHILSAGGTGYSYNKLRLVLTNWQGTNPRIATIGARYYNSSGLASTLLSLGGGTIYGNLVVTGTIDGRDISVDGAKLDGIASGATANTGTVTGVTGTAPIVSSGGTAPAISMAAATASVNGYMTSTYAAKLDGIAANATANTGTVTSVSGTGTVSGLTLSGTVTGSGSLTLSGTISTLNQNTTGSAGSVVNTVAGTGTLELVRGNMADNDQFRILIGGTSTNAGYVEIATADDGTEPIYVRQYTGTFATLTRTATLLDGSGNTSFPGTVTSNGTTLTGNTGTVTSVGGTGSVSGLTLSGTVTGSGNLTLGGTLSLTSGNVTTALGYTPYNSTNPNGYITSSGSAASAGFLNVNTDLTYGNNGLNYFNISGTAGNIANSNSTPTSAWYHILRMNHGNAVGYFVDIAAGLTGSSLHYRMISNGTAYGWFRVLDDSNYNSYSPTLTGTGASGTWGINITGTAGSISGYNNPTTASTGNTIVYRDGNGYITNNYFYTSGGGSERNASAMGYFAGFNSGDYYIRSYTPAAAASAMGALTTGNYNSYSPTLTGTGASGTWGINITGTATTATNLSGGTVNSSGNSVFSFTHGQNLKVGMPAASNSGGTGDNYLYLWQSEPGVSWTGGGIARNMVNTTGFPRVNTGLWGQMIHFEESGQITFTIETSGGTRYTPLTLNTSGNASFAGSMTASNFSGSSSGTNTGDQTNISGNAATASYAAEVNAAFGRTDGTAYPVCWIANNTNKSQAYSCSAVTITSSTGQLSASILYSSGAVTAFSDERVKTNWTNFGSNFVEELAKIKSGTYDRTDIVLTQVGVSAQSLQKLMPPAISEDEHGNLSVSYGHAAMVSAVELAKRVVEQDERIARLEAIINKLIEDK